MSDKKVICADATCKWNGDGNICTCQRIALSYESVMTYHQGRREFRTCRTYEKDETVAEIKYDVNFCPNCGSYNGG